jgi:putative Mg2+ transporter-C (MgtC) family protein
MEHSIELLPIFGQLAIAFFLGAILGLERLIARKEAGMRTFGIVAIASCLFVVVGELVAYKYIATFNLDPLRMASAVVTGIGFIGAGLIIFQHELKGLTTAATLWAASAIGVAVGFEFYSIASFATFLVLFVCVGIWHFERFIERITTDTPEAHKGTHLSAHHKNHDHYQ